MSQQPAEGNEGFVHVGIGSPSLKSGQVSYADFPKGEAQIEQFFSWRNYDFIETT
ncbi:MAG: hypothetical protein HYS07_10445 [Chlamydiae bacterium]|nr:hypothetical protein [Chlamydiota bacterium]